MSCGPIVATQQREHKGLWSRLAVEGIACGGKGTGDYPVLDGQSKAGAELSGPLLPSRTELVMWSQIEKLWRRAEDIHFGWDLVALLPKLPSAILSMITFVGGLLSPLAFPEIFVLTLAAFAMPLLAIAAWKYVRTTHKDKRLDTKRDTAPQTKAQALPIAPKTTELPFLAPDDAELEIVMEREEFHPFQYKANILEAKIRIRNKSTKIKYPGGQRWEIRQPEGSNSYFTDIEVHREVVALADKRSKLAGQIAPLDTITGWSVVALPHQPRGGIGAYTLTIEDEVGTQYILRRERRGARF